MAAPAAPHGAIEMLAKLIAAVTEDYKGDDEFLAGDIVSVEDGVGCHIETPSGDKWFILIKWDRESSP